MAELFECCPGCGVAAYHLVLGERETTVGDDSFKVNLMVWNRPEPVATVGGKRTVRVRDRECRECRHTWTNELGDVPEGDR